MAVIEDTIGAIIALAQHCVCTTFTDLCECCGHSGSSLPPASDCCECEPGKNGRAYIQVVRAFPTGKPTVAKASQAKCGSGRMAVEFAVTIYRCVEVIDGETGHPSCEATTEEMFRNITDMRLVREALLCCLREEADDNAGLQIQILEQSPLDPQGGCGGTVTRAVASADNFIMQSAVLRAM